MNRLVYAVLVGLVGAGIVHISILFLVPVLTVQDAWSRLASLTGYYAVSRISGTGEAAPIIKAVDPLFEAAACRFDLGDGIAHITGEGEVPFWSISVYDRSGQNLFSFNDRTATNTDLDVAVLSPLQMVEMRKDMPATFQNSIFVEARIEEGIIVVRSFVPDETWRAKVNRFLDEITCISR